MATYEIGRVCLGTERVFGWNSTILSAVLGEVVFTAFDTFRYVVTVVIGMAVGLTILVLWWTTTGQMRFFDYNFGIK
jgi:hypothetical protein